MDGTVSTVVIRNLGELLTALIASLRPLLQPLLGGEFTVRRRLRTEPSADELQHPNRQGSPGSFPASSTRLLVEPLLISVKHLNGFESTVLCKYGNLDSGGERHQLHQGTNYETQAPTAACGGETGSCLLYSAPLHPVLVPNLGTQGRRVVSGLVCSIPLLSKQRPFACFASADVLSTGKFTVSIAVFDFSKYRDERHSTVPRAGGPITGHFTSCKAGQSRQFALLTYQQLPAAQKPRLLIRGSSRGSTDSFISMETTNFRDHAPVVRRISSYDRVARQFLLC